MKKVLASILALLMVVACFAGCGETEAPVQDVTTETDTPTAITGEITMWVWSSVADEIAAYEASHPGTKINEVVIASGDYLSKIQTTIATGGELPDIVLGEILNRGQLFSMDICEDLSAEPYNFDASKVDQSVIGTMKDADGRVLGLEQAIVPAGLAYQRDLTQQYLGVSEPEDVSALLDNSWDKFIEVGKQVKEDSDGSMYMFTSLGDAYYILTGQIDTPRISGETINTASVLELFDKICQLRDAGIVSKIEQWTPAWFASFGAQDAMFAAMPMFGIVNWVAPYFENGEANWGLIVPPEGGVNWGGTSMSITKESKNKALAWDFIEWFIYGDGAALRYDLGEPVSAANFYVGDKVDNYSNSYFGGQNTVEVYINEIAPTIKSAIPTIYDFADICTIEVILSSLNADYSMTAQDAVDLYITEMTRQAPELSAK